MPQPEKRQIMQALLDTSKICTDLFDVVEADEPFDLAMMNRVGAIARALTALHSDMILDYVLSGRAGDDMLDHLRNQLGGRLP